MSCAAVLVSMFFVPEAMATTTSGSCSTNGCYQMASDVDSDIWEEAQYEYDEFLDQDFQRLERFIVNEMWEQSILPVLMEGAAQFTTVAMQQAMTIGMFIDAQNQLESQRLLQEIHAQAYKDYHPSVGLCEFGSVVKSIAATERRSEVQAVTLSQRSIDRQLGQTDSSGMYGFDIDHTNKLIQFRNVYCNVKDRNSSLSGVCASKLEWDDTHFRDVAKPKMNKDIDYFSLVDTPWTLSIDFTNEEIFRDNPTSDPAILAIDNSDEEHVLAMANNLYGELSFARPPARLLQNRPEDPISKMQQAYLDLRSIVAKRSVAENSFYAIAAMKAEGNYLPDEDNPPQLLPMSARPYMENILEELGVPSADILDALGENPSYYAQMEVLTKKIYQNPDFYTNLYDKPANVERKAVALQAVKLMQKFDMLKSFHRNEATVSLLLELAVVDLQDEVEDQIRAVGLGKK